MPYNLQNLATRARTWRTIEPTAALQSDLFSIGYRPILQAWQNAAAAMLPAYAAALVSGSVDELAAEEQSHAQEIAALLLFIQWSAYFARLEAWHRRKWLASTANAAGVDVAPYLAVPNGVPATPNRATRRATASGLRAAAREAVRVQRGAVGVVSGLSGIDAVLGNAVAANASLVRSVSEQTRARIANAVFNGVTAKTPVEDVALEISKGLALSKKRALRIAKNEVTQATKALNKFRIEEAGFTSAAWSHSHLPEHPRILHIKRDNQEFNLEDPVWRELSLPFCRCSMKPPRLVLVRGRGNAALQNN